MYTGDQLPIIIKCLSAATYLGIFKQIIFLRSLCFAKNVFYEDKAAFVGKRFL